MTTYYVTWLPSGNKAITCIMEMIQTMRANVNNIETELQYNTKQASTLRFSSDLYTSYKLCDLSHEENV